MGSVCASFEEFVTDVADRLLDGLHPTAAQFIRDEIASGEFETAAVWLIEDAPVTAHDVNDFEKLVDEIGHEIGGPNHIEVARRLIACAERSWLPD